MEEYNIITFTATNCSISADNLLEDKNIPHKLIPLPLQISAGCGLCLKLPLTEAKNAIDAIDKAGIQIENFYYAVKEGLNITLTVL